METKNIIVSVYANASGFLWSMSNMAGTDLGYSEYNGDHLDSGSFTTYERAFKDALDMIDLCDTSQFRKDTPYDKFHWGNYTHHLDKYYRKNKKNG